MSIDNLTQEEKNEQFREAIILEDIKKAEELRLSGADINTVTEKGNSSLFLAVNKNKKKSFAYLIDRGINLNLLDSNNENILMHLIRHNKKQFIDYLLEKAGNKIDFEQSNQYGANSLIYTALFNDTETLKKLFEINPHINIHAKTEQKNTALLIFAGNYNKEAVKLLLDNGANINDVDYYGKNVLINAIMNNPKINKKENEKNEDPNNPPDIAEKMEGDYLETIKILVEKGIDINYKANSGLNALFAACYYDASGLAAQYLLENGADFKFTHTMMTVDNISPLTVAMEGGKAKLAEMILSKMSDEEKKEWMNKQNSDGNSPAAFGFLHNKLRELTLDNFADPNTIIKLQDDKIPALSFLISRADLTATQRLVSEGAQTTYPEDSDFFIYEPIKMAIISGSATILETLIKTNTIDLNKEIKITEEFSTTPLSFLMTNSVSRTLQTFIKQKKEIEMIINQKMGDGSNAYKLPEETRQELKGELDKLKNLEEQLVKNRELMLNLLLDNGAKINEQDNNGRTSLFYITEKEYIDTMLKKGADFFIQDNEGNNPLSFAIKNNSPIAQNWLEYIIDNNLAGHQQIQNLLIDIMYTSSNSYYSQNQLKQGLMNAISPGSSLLNKQDNDGNTPLIIAVATGQTPVAATLVDLGSDVNLTNKLGETALMHAIARKNTDLVKFLIEKGSDVKAKAKNKKTVLDFAQELGDKEILSMINNKLHPEKSYSSGKRIIK